MRALLPLFLLIALMAAAWAWQERWTGAARQQRDVLRGRAAPASVEERGTRLVLGRPSGRPPHDVPYGPFPFTGEGPSIQHSGGPAPGEGEPQETELAPWEPVFEVEVRPGKVLSILCQEFYGTSRPPVVQRVAEWNGLSSPDHLKAGQLLELPARAWVFAEAP